MSAPLKVLIMTLIWLVYTFLLFSMTATKQEKEKPAEPTDSTTVELARFPIDFKWSDATAYTNAGLDSLKDAIMASFGPDKILEITGLYHEEEEKPADYASMGFARAEQIKAMFAELIPDSSIRTKARVINEKEGVREGYFNGVDFSWLDVEKKEAETIVELDDRIIIRFPFGSAAKEYDPAVDKYLEDLVKRVKETGETISLTGHTDDVDSDEVNRALGMERANGIKAILVKKGVDAALIQTDSKGESQPQATNDTPEGRHENRRVEVRLNKKEG